MATVTSEEAGPTTDDVIRLLTEEAVQAVFQPIVAMSDGAIVGYEALARMQGPPQAGPDVWLTAASGAGLRTELELLCLKAALASGLPPGSGRLFVNLSPSVLLDPRMLDLVPAVMVPRLVFELSETEVILDYEVVRRAMLSWSAAGANLAIDDTGSGYASLRHVLQLSPEVIKLDQSLIDGIEHDRNRRALAAALTTFARELGAEVVAEGVESSHQLAVLEASGVGLVQGYLLARPGPAWPSAANPREPDAPSEGGPVERFRAAIATATDATAACRVTADFLAHLPGVMPSVYLLHGDRLRCQAQSGLWQVLDGLEPGRGVTGRCFERGEEYVIDDVGSHLAYLEAIPGISSEACVPIRVEGMTVGALNIDSRRAINDVDLQWLRVAAEELGARLLVVGREPARTPFDRLGVHFRALSAAPGIGHRVDVLLSGCLDVSGMDSAAYVALDRLGADDGAGDRVVARGPLRGPLRALVEGHQERVEELVAGVTSCYTTGGALGQSFVGFDELREAGVRSMALIPVTGGGERAGLLLLASLRSSALDTSDIEPLEMLASHAAVLMGRRPPATVTSLGTTAPR
jgi:EAL domain-containing protein (putative c-di-GMP-specific phosphodiesterase class I)/putative methionine-R-sulfoxide reductase with GAF domain